MVLHHASRTGSDWGKRLVRVAAAAITTTALAGFVGVFGAATAAPAGAAGAACTFSFGSQAVSGTASDPGVLTGLSNNSTVGVTCSGMNTTHTYAVFEGSPLAVVTQPFSLSVLGSLVDISSGANTLNGPNSSGVYAQNLVVGTNAGGGFSSGGSIAGTTFAPDQNAVCPPTQAEVNAGLGTCLVVVADITATTGGGPPSQANYAGEALIDFTGQPTPQTPPTVGFNPPVVAPGRNATLSDTGASTNWWGGGWWGGGYPGGSLQAAPFPIPASNVLVNGAPASSASVSVAPAVYCFYGGASATSCNGGTADTPGAGVMFPSHLQGTVAIPSNVGASAAVSIYEPNVWGSLFAGNNTNPAFPANDLAATGSIAITHIGYWEVASDGGIFSFGTANFYGSMGGQHLNKPIVGVGATPDGNGYWEVASDGGIFSFGDAQFHGSMGGTPLAAPIVGLVPTFDGGGYWEVASDGGIFSFGDAGYFGSTSGQLSGNPIVGMAATPDAGGYWLVANNGAVFAFGDARFLGSLGGQPLNAPIIGIAGTPDGGGYWLVARDGGIFAYGDAGYYGSPAGMPLNQPIVGMWGTTNGHGYWETASDGGIFSYGNAAFLGSMGGIPLNKPIVGGTAVPTLPSSTISVTGSTSANGFGAAGQTVPFTYLVTNTGASKLTNVAVNASRGSVSCTSTVLLPGGSENCSGSYTVTQADVDAGAFTNTVTASGNGFLGVPVTSSPNLVTVPASQAVTTIGLTEGTTSTGYGAAGETVDFQYTISDTGTTSVNDLAVTDSVTNGNGDVEAVSPTCPSVTLAPGQSAQCTATYTITQDDVDFAPISTNAQATASSLTGSPGTSPSATITVQAKYATAGVSLVKSTTSNGYSAAGQQIPYSYVVTNTGTISLTEVSVADFVPSTGATIDVTCPLDPSATLAPGASETCTATYTTTSADVTAGSVTNLAIATAVDVLNFNEWQAPSTVTVSKT